MKILETDRLILRHLVPEDLDALFAIYSDPEVVRYIPDAPRNYEETRQELEWHMHGHPKHPELGLWATMEKETGRLIGRCGLLPWTLDGREEVEVAYLLGRDHWGKGLGTEAARAIKQYAFERLHLRRLVSLIDPDNIASAQVARNIGMTLEREMEDELGPFLLYSMEAIIP
jgi:ribosomal-protein-alanine N-acetyltransferase